MFKTGTICVITEKYPPFRKGEIVIITDIDGSDPDHYHYWGKKIAGFSRKSENDEICCDVIKKYMGTDIDLKAIKEKEIELHCIKMFKKQHYYKTYILKKAPRK